MNKIRLFACMVFVLALTTGVNAQDGISTDQKVDLGLSVCWAGWNVGASSPEEYGDYYAWGETTTKSDYGESSYQYHDGSDYVDIGCDISGTQYDVARTLWGGNWRLPTEAEFQELISCCSWTWTTYKEVEGYKVTGPNGSSIFFPAAGAYSDTELDGTDLIGCYWSDLLSNDHLDYAYSFLFFNDGSSDGGFVSNFSREYGLSVRPVCEAPETSAQQDISTDRKVDLGLSVYWAGWNVGASSPKGYGKCYAWGETTAKSDYSHSSYQYFDGNSNVNISNDICGMEYDVARAQWGGNWRMPTKTECQELIDRCDWTWVTYNGISGYKVTGPNGNSIFLPAAGYRGDSWLYDIASYGYYWSGSLGESDSNGAYVLYFNSSGHGTQWQIRSIGYTVRPVCDK